jgi:hypothetical protein
MSFSLKNTGRVSATVERDGSQGCTGKYEIFTITAGAIEFSLAAFLNVGGCF